MTPSGTGRILVLDPDSVNARMISALFNDAANQVVIMESVPQLLVQAFDPGADAILLEADCYNTDGFDLCAKLRARGYRGPVIFITARDRVNDKVRAFQAGADDYVVKPYDARELLARVAAVCRRFRDAQRLVLGRELRVGDATLTPGTGVFRIDGLRPVYLSPTEVRLLECLMRESPITISREALLDLAWPNAFAGDASRVEVVIARIRKKIEFDPSEPVYLHTLRGFGYSFRPNGSHPLPAEESLDHPASVHASLMGA